MPSSNATGPKTSAFPGILPRPIGPEIVEKSVRLVPWTEEKE